MIKVKIFPTKEEMGAAAAQEAARLLQAAIETKGKAVFVAATGASQFDFLTALTRIPSIEWAKTEMFHLDEYIGIPESHPASFRRYLRERLIDRVHPGQVYLIEGDAPDPERECERLSQLISEREVDVAFVGIGENGHLAFNDPPADFETDRPYIIVELAETARRQQVREGWFTRLKEVPTKAISMSIRQIMKAKSIICTVPEARKARAVKAALEGEISPEIPASILRKHKDARIFLDREAAQLLDESFLAGYSH
jgi:glucosamine-6-phosphate deaminase